MSLKVSDEFLNKYGYNKKKRKEEEEDGLYVSDEFLSTMDTLDDIAPIPENVMRKKEEILNFGKKKTTAKEEEEERTWFTKGAFEDGYDFGDVTKTLFATGKDLRVNAYAGALGLVESAIDTGADLVGGIGGLLGANKFQDKMAEFIAKDIIKEEELAVLYDKYAGPKASNWVLSLEDLFANPKDYDQLSVLGEKSDSLTQAAGQQIAALGLQSVGVPWQVTMGLSSYGSELENALNNGATVGEARFSAAVSAGAEILTGSLFKIPGIASTGSGAVGQGIVGKLTKNISSTAVKNLINYGVNVLGEGAEEVITSFFQRFGQVLSYEREDTWKELAENEEARNSYVTQVLDKLFGKEAREEYGESFIGGSVLAGLGGAHSTISATKAGQDVNTGLTADEQTILDKVAEEKIAEKEKDGKKLTAKQKVDIEEQVRRDLEKGYISAEKIEEIFGGEKYDAYRTARGEFLNSDDYKAYQKAVEAEEKAKAEFDPLVKMVTEKMTGEQIYRRDELKKMLDESKVGELKAKLDASAKNVIGLRNQMRGDVMARVKDTRLAESYRELIRKKQKFTVDINKYENENARKTVQSIIDSGLGDNSNQFHETVEWLAQISADKNVTFTLTNNERIKGTEHYKEGYITNGFVNENGDIVLNKDGKVLNTTVGHEITHVLKKTDPKGYEILQKAVLEYAVTKEGKAKFDARIAEAREAYKDKKNTTAEEEVTADIIGEYLFNDYDFVHSLAVSNRSNFQKILEEIKYMAKIATAGSREARELEKAKRLFEKVWRETAQVEGNSGKNTNYSLEKSNKGKYNKRSQYSETETLFLSWENGSAPVGEVKRFTRFGKTRYYEKTENGCVELSRQQYNERTGVNAENTYRRAEREISEAYDHDESTQRGLLGNHNSDRDTSGDATVFGQTIREELPDVTAGSERSTPGYDSRNDLNQTEYTEEASAEEQDASFITFSNDYATIRNHMKDGDVAEEVDALGKEILDSKSIQYSYSAIPSHKKSLEKNFDFENASMDLETINQRYDKIIDIWERLGGELDSKFLNDWNNKVERPFTVFKAQAGYKYNIELSSMCKKGVPLFEAIDTIVKKEVMKELGTDVLGKAEKEILYDILKKHHFEIPCAICYVEQARQREGVIIDAFLNGKTEVNGKGETTSVKLGWNNVLDAIQKEMKANGVDHNFAFVSRDIATDKYTPADLSMDEKTYAAFAEAVKKIANEEITRYNKEEGKNRKLLKEVTPEAVSECFKGTLPSNLKIFKVLLTEPSSRFKIQDDLLYSSMTTKNLTMAHNGLYGLFNSQGGVSGYKTKQAPTVYWGEILGKKWKPADTRKEGGIRNQSNSDFQMYTLLDQAQMYMDFSAKGYYLQAYTKVLSELKLFGLSKSKINASLIPKVKVYRNADGSVDVEKTMATAGLDENGNPFYDDIEGINHKEAFMLLEDPEYSKSIGGICIGYSDNHIWKLLDDNRVQLIIGFHDKTNDPDKRYSGAKYAKNYNGLNEAVNNKDGKTVHIGFNPFVKKAENKFKYNSDTETFEGTVEYNGKTYTADDIPRLAADLYLEHCAKKNYMPAYDAFKGHQNYYKLLADFSLYDSQGHYAPHQKVAYNMPDTVPYLDADGNKQYMDTEAYIKAELKKELAVRDALTEALADTSEDGIIPQFVAEVNKRKGKTQYSLSKDSDGNQLTKAQEEFFKDSKMRDADGNLKPMYHGTENAGFHTFMSEFSDDGSSFFFVDSNEVAESYSGTSETYTARTFQTADDFNKFFAEIGATEYSVAEEDGRFILMDDGDEIASSESGSEIFDEFKDYSGLGHGSANYKTYLNIKNPLIVDADERSWNDLPGLTKGKYEYIKMLDASGEKAKIEYGLVGDPAPIVEYVNIDEKFDDNLAYKVSNLGQGEILEGVDANPATTRDYSKYAKENGYDGVIFNNIYDIGGWGSPIEGEATVAIVFDSNQIKSVANENPTSDADIRYSMTKADADYLDAVNRDDMETVQRMVDESAKNAGFTPEHLFHGTSGFGFTKIDTKQSDDSISFFVSDKVDVAQGYFPYFEDESGEYHDSVRAIGKPSDKPRSPLYVSMGVEEVVAKVKEAMPEQYANAKPATKEEVISYLNRTWIPKTASAATELKNYSIPKNVESLVDSVIEANSKGTYDSWKAVADRYKEFADIYDIYYNGQYFPQASMLWFNIQSGMQMANKALRPDVVYNNEEILGKNVLVERYNDYLAGEGNGVYDLYANHNNQLVIRGRGSNWNDLPLGEATKDFNDWWVNEEGHEPSVSGQWYRADTRSIAKYAKARGYRSVRFEDIYDAGAYGDRSEISTVYAFFYPEEDIKSADPVTYDDSDNVIPLSKRFDRSNDDIRYSVSKEGAEQNTYGDWRIDGREFGKVDPLEEFAPVREDVAQTAQNTENVPPVAENTTTAPYEDNWKDSFEAITDADAPPVKENAPVKEISTVAERIQAQIDNAQAELNNNRRLRDQSYKDYDEEIASLQAEYDAKKNKNTLGAQNILRRIERLKRLQADNNANYAKRISDLEARVEKLHSKEYSRAEHRRAKSEEYTKMWEDMIGDTSTWKDMPIGLQYKVKTLRRILRKVVKDSFGNSDFRKADEIYDELETKYDHNEALLKRESQRMKEVFQDLNLNKYEDTYAHMAGEFRHNPETELTAEMVKEYYDQHKKHIDTDKVNKAIEESRKTFDELIGRVNKVLKEQGFKEIPYRKGYFPHFTNPKQNWLQKALNWKPVDNEIPTSIAGLTETFKPQRSWQKFDKQRKGDKTDYSLYQGLDTYIHGALDWIYHIEDLQKRRALENHIRYVHSEEGVKQRIQAIKSENYDADEAQQMIDSVLKEANNPLSGLVRELMNRTNTLANKKSSMDRGMEDATNRKIYSTMTNLNNRINANMVVGSFSSALTNFIPMVQSWHQVSPVYTVRGLGDMIRSTINDDGMIAKSDFLTNRLIEEEKLYQTGWDKVSDKAAFMMNAIDNITSQTVWRSKYLQNIHEGMSENAAIKDADQFAKNLMAGRSRGNAPTIFDAKNPLIKIATAFQLEVANQYGYMFEDVVQDSTSKARLVKGYATAFVGAYLYNALYSSLVGRDAAFDPIGIIEELLGDLFDDDEEPEDALMNFGKNVLEEVPFVGGLLGGGRIPMSSALPYSSDSNPFQSMLTDVTEGNMESFGKELLKPLYYLVMPVGGGQIKKTAEGLGMFLGDHPVSGSYTDSGKLRFPVDPTLGNVAQAALFGQYASKNARYYFDNDIAPLGEKQIQEYMDLDIPIRDYWDYRDGLKGLNTIAEKADYIDSLDLPVSKKNLLINNIADRKAEINMETYGEYDSFEEFDYAQKNPEKYDFLTSMGVTYSQYKNADDYTKDAYDWAFENPEAYTVSKAISGDYLTYYRYKSDMSKLNAKDANGETVSGLKKERVIDYINGLNIDYGQKIILYRSMYDGKADQDAYNKDILEYLGTRDDLSHKEIVTILKKLGFKVSSDGKTVTW